MYLIVGLGNPGKQYAGTRHNIGFETIDYICLNKNVKLDKAKFNAVYGEFRLDGHRVILAKPMTYMNKSGNAVIDIARYYKIETEKIIVIYDDVDLDQGKLRIRPNGSAGTHNGMKSIIFQLQSEDFPRIRIGIGRPSNMELADYVLQRFSTEEIDVIKEVAVVASKAADEIILNGVDSAMNKYNIR
jgi:PTH1 family peptidyl-tRNA hydrolase